MTSTPEPQPVGVTCTRCRRDDPAGLDPDATADEALAAWHQTETGWVCDHCWTELERRHELGLCRLCGRDAHSDEIERGVEWRRPDENGDLICPECHFGGRNSIIVQAAKSRVRRWHQEGVFTRFEALVDGALARERKIIIAMLREQIAREGARPSSGEWEEMVTVAIEAARRRWPKPVGEG